MFNGINSRLYVNHPCSCQGVLCYAPARHNRTARWPNHATLCLSSRSPQFPLSGVSLTGNGGASTATKLQETRDANRIAHLGKQHWPIALDRAAGGLYKVVQTVGSDLGTVIMQDHRGVGAQEFILLLLGKLRCRYVGHGW